MCVIVFLDACCCSQNSGCYRLQYSSTSACRVFVFIMCWSRHAYLVEKSSEARRRGSLVLKLDSALFWRRPYCFAWASWRAGARGKLVLYNKQYLRACAFDYTRFGWRGI